VNRIEMLFDSDGFQSGIRSDQKLGELAKQNPAVGNTSNTFGFAAKSKESKFFIIGALFSEALAYFNRMIWRNGAISYRNHAILRRHWNTDSETIRE